MISVVKWMVYVKAEIVPVEAKQVHQWLSDAKLNTQTLVI